MLQNYFKLAWRNIIKRSFYSALNIMGLAIGLVFCLVISVYIWNEFQVNRRLSNPDSQYFLTSKWKDPNMGPEITAPGPLSRMLKEEFPDLIANYYRWDGITSVVSKGDLHLRENIQIGDSTFLSMYGFKLLHGDPASALLEPFSIVITKDIALKYFARTDVVGETLDIQSFSNTNHAFLIKGVLDDIPENTVTQLNSKNNNSIFVPLNTAYFWNRANFEDWVNIYTPSYIQLKPGIGLDRLNAAIITLLQKHSPDLIRQNLKVSPIALTEYYLQKNDRLVGKLLYALSLTGLFILLMAVVNFVNISINSSAGRVKEIGVRKVLGGIRRHIILQFLTESVILVLIASIIAACAYPFLRNSVSGILGKAIPDLLSLPPYFLISGIVVILLLGMLAGLYPAMLLSSHKSVDSLKGKLKNVGQRIWIRKSLAGLQFCIAAVVMIAAFVISGQVRYFLNEDLGYDKDFVVSSQVPRDWSPEGVLKMETIRNQLASLPNVRSVSLSYEIPDGNNGGQRQVYRPGTDISKAIPLQVMITDENYLSTYGIKMNQGHFFKQGDTDLLGIVLNETAAKALGWENSAEAIGREVKFPESSTAFIVKGITKDFHFNSKHEKIQPIIFLNTKLSNNYRFLSFKISPSNSSATISAIERKWSALMPGSSFEYRFMDEALNEMYETEIRMKMASDIATILSFVIALVGIFGLVSLNIQKRAKEISIRKVLGAELMSILFIFLKEFITIIIISILIASPIAWYIMKSWLNDYVYRIDLSLSPFINSFAIILASSVMLILIQTIKTAFAKPVDNLKME